MQVSFMISTLLAGLTFFLSFHAVDSLSVSRRSEPQLFTVPLKRISEPDNIHPQILLQMQINRGVRRLAKMTGAEPPSVRSLQKRLERRILSLDIPSGIDRRFNRLVVHRNVGDVQLEKRFNRVGVLKSRRKGIENSESVEESVEAAVTPTVSNSLGLNIEGLDEGYLATVQIGTPPRKFSVLMDSGSADFWVGAEGCEVQNDLGCGNHPFLGPESSSSFIDTFKAFEDTYGTGQVSGNIITDNVLIGNLALNNHTFGVATVESSNFAEAPFDGLMGLAQSTLSAQNTSTPTQALADNGLVSDPIVSFKLGRTQDKVNDGEVTFGGLDQSKFDSSTLITLPSINPSGFWECNMDTVIINGQDLMLTGRSATLDTGTTLMILPQSEAQIIQNNIPGSNLADDGSFTVPCNTNTSIALKFGGQEFPIDLTDLILQPSDANGNCNFGINGVGTGDLPQSFTKLTWLAGATFLKNAYFSTNVQTNTVSLAQLV